MYISFFILIMLSIVWKVHGYRVLEKESKLGFVENDIGEDFRQFSDSPVEALKEAKTNENEQLLGKLFPIILYISEFGKNATKVPLAYDMTSIDCFPIFHHIFFQKVFDDKSNIDSTRSGKKLIMLDFLTLDRVKNTVQFLNNDRKYVTLKCLHRPQSFEDLENLLLNSAFTFFDKNKIKIQLKEVYLQLNYNPLLLGFHIKSLTFDVISPLELVGTFLWLGNRKYQGKTLSKVSITYYRNSPNMYQHLITTCQNFKNGKSLLEHSEDILKIKGYANKRKVTIINVSLPINVYTKPLQALFDAALTMIQLAKLKSLAINVPKENTRRFVHVYKSHLNTPPYSEIVANSRLKLWIQKCLELHVFFMSPEIRKISWKTAKVIALTLYEDKTKLGIALHLNYDDNWKSLLLDLTLQPDQLDNKAPLFSRLEHNFFKKKKLISYIVVSVKDNYVSKIVNRAGVIKLNFDERIYRIGKTIIFEQCRTNHFRL